MKGVVFLVLAPFYKRDYDRFGIELVRKQLNVYVFDFTAFFRPEYFCKTRDRVYKFSGYYSVESFKKFLGLKKKLNINFACDFLNISWASFAIRGSLKAQRVHISKFQNGYMLEPVDLGRLEKLRGIPNKFMSLSRLTLTLFKAIFPKVFFHSDTLFVGGLNQRDKITRKYSKEVVFGHSWDYDRFLKESEDIRVHQKPYAVFLDQDFAYHPNYKWMGIKPHVTPQRYFKALENFFTFYEKKTDIEVVIAAHPRSNELIYSKAFKRRKVIFGETAKLIKGSELVFHHQSSALSYVVLFKKKFILIKTHEMAEERLMKTFTLISNYFNAKIINIDNFRENDLEEEIKKPLDILAYREYVEEFMRHPSAEDKFFWQIYLDHVCSRVQF